VVTIADPQPRQASTTQRSTGATRSRRPVSRDVRPRTVAVSWLGAQSINASRHAAALRPFHRQEFGNTPAAPTQGHIKAVNDLITQLRRDLLREAGALNQVVTSSTRSPSTANLRRMLELKEEAHRRVQAIEKIWDFYFELFGQRQSRYGEWLLGCDRIALDCYQSAYRGIGVARSIPAPPPFAYMRTGFSPATFRRGIPLRRLGRQLNPFPLVQLPYHRLVNPWTLGAVLHEVSHNLQNDLGLAQVVPQAIGRRISEAGYSREVAATWVRWNREIFADLSGLLLGRGQETVVTYQPTGPHPTPYLRAYLSFELLRRIGFPKESDAFRRLWQRLYPHPGQGTIPPQMLKTGPDVIPLVVDTMCFKPFPVLGNKRLADVLRFAPKDQHMIEEAARRIAAGTDPGVIPERFLIGAARFALDNRLARPGVITENFYTELARR
jgi:hypothetical protein